MSGTLKQRATRIFERAWPYLLCVVVVGGFCGYFAVDFRGPEVKWRHPGALALLLGVPLGAWVGFALGPRRSGTFLFSRTFDLGEVAEGAGRWLRPLPRVLQLAALALVTVALARPQTLTSDVSDVEGIDIVIALDVSNSMAETDLVPDRIGAAKRVIDDFIRRRASDRLGLVIFGKEAFTQCPLTLDNRALRSLLADVRLGLVDGQGTAIGNALGTAINRLRKSTAKSRVIVLVTDGDDNASKIDPLKAARYAQSFGIKVFTILIGRDILATGEPGTDRFGNVVVNRPRYPVNPKLLEEIAGLTGGTPYLATDTEALQRRFQAILEDLDRSKLRAQTPHYGELYPRLIFCALGLLLLATLLELTRLRRFP